MAALDRQHPRDLFDVMQLFAHEGITPGIRRAFVVYLASSNRPVHEVLFPVMRDIRHDYEHNFQGMTAEPVPLDALLAARERMVRELQRGLDDDERRFLVSLVAGTPDWSLLGIAHLEHLPGIRWKLHNLVQLQTKWVWPRRGVVQDLMRQLLDAVENVGFHALCGLRAEPARLRMRVLCPRLRARVGGLCDIEAPIAELAALQLAPTISLVVENLNTGIALPDIDGTVAFMGLGLAVDQLEAIGWLRGAQRHLYWGDLDTHGFAILARARRRFPNTMSVLMDEDTLLAHRKLWVREPTPCRVESPEGLTAAELAVYEGLRANRWGERVRLEQERIAWPAALEAISNALGNHP